MVIKIIGTVSSKRDYLLTVVQTAIWELKLDVKVIKIEEEREISSYGITNVPCMMIDDKLIIEGIVPGITEIKNFIKKFNDRIP